MGSRWLRNGFIYLLILIAVIAIVYSMFFARSGGVEEKNLTEVLADAKAGQVAEIVVSGDSLTVTYTSGTEFKSRKEEGASIVDLLREEGVEVGPGGVNVQVKKPGGFPPLGLAR